ncbi:MAG TPA: hypothetical protein VL576_03145 [Candidatus Paceibacterota bacterium]|jgi:hypothetical protein|nr:hypothetical protein [Candidatus Paceibacterota bacterium]
MKDFKKYFIVLLITAGLFAVAWSASEYFNDQKIAEIQKAQDQATVDVMSSETQFDLLEEQSCQDIGNNYLAQEISDLADKISYAEQNINDQTQIALLKQQYSVLEVKDFLLNKQISARCKTPIATILYFYKTDNTCADCTKQGYVLDALRQNYPQIRVYSFDAGLDSSTIRALLTIYKVPDNLPALIINGKTKSGFMSMDDITKLLPKTVINPVTPKATTSTPAVTSKKQVIPTSQTSQ